MELTLSEKVWSILRAEAQQLANSEPFLANFFNQMLLKHLKLAESLSYILASKLTHQLMPRIALRELIHEAYHADPAIVLAATRDIIAIKQRDPAITHYLTPLLYLKGFHALQAYRIAHWLWQQERYTLAIYWQNSVSVIFGVDIHPAAKIGSGVMLDHATGIIIGETATVEDDVSLLQSVTLGGTGKVSGDRHPKVRRGVMIGAGATILGNIEIGEGAKVGAGSVVLISVPPHTTVVGVPAKIIGKPNSQMPAMDMDQTLMNDYQRIKFKQ